MSPKQSSTRGDDVPAGAAPAFPPPRRRFGQNFLTDATAIRRIVAALDPRPAESVLEIGPGRGSLTAALLETVPVMAAIEVDRDLVATLRSRYPEDRLRLIARNVLDVAFDAMAPRMPLVVAGNLPYNISKPFAMKLVDEHRAIARAVLMFQREVAERLTAVPRTKAYGPLTVLAGRLYRIERLFDLPPGAFRPRPKVVSCVTRWTPRNEDALPDALVPPLKAVLRAAFAHRRQTLLKNMRGAVPGGEGRARELLGETGLDGSLRAEEIPPDAFVALARLWR